MTDKVLCERKIASNINRIRHWKSIDWIFLWYGLTGELATWAWSVYEIRL